MKKLHEEFKEYESLWEDISTEEPGVEKAESTEMEVEKQKLMDELELETEEEVIAWWKQHNYYVEVEYPAYTDSWEEDAWDPESQYGHYTIPKSEHHDDFVYHVDVEDALDFVWENIIFNDDKYLTSAYLDRAVKKLQKQAFFKDRLPQIAEGAQKLLADYEKVKAFYEKWDDEDILKCFAATHLDSFEYYYAEEFKDYYYDQAHN